MAELTSRFSDVADSHSALQILRKIKQNRSETIQAFHERIMDVAEQAFVNVNLADFAYQEQLVVCFTDGLCDNRIARHIIRQRPTNLKEALKAAMTERNMLRQLDIRGKNDRENSSAPSDRREEPMDIGAVNVVCFRCQKPGHLKKDCRVVLPKSFPTQSRNMFDGHCFSCERYGHKAVSCYSPNVSKNVNVPPYRVPLHKREAVEKAVEDMLESGIVRPSISQYNAPVVAVKKPNSDSYRICIDFRAVNSIT